MSATIDKVNPKDEIKHYDDGSDRSLTSRSVERTELNSGVAHFLEQGGKITSVDPNVMGDPPKKPVSNYGSRPI